MEVILFIIFLAIFIGGGIWCRNAEKASFNNGICPHCGGELRYFDSTSQGDRGYICDACHYHCWCSYNVDKVRKE